MSEGFIYRALPEEMAKQWNNFLPGIDTIIFIAGDGGYSEWIASEWTRKGDKYSKRELLLLEDISDKLLRIRSNKNDFQWITKQQIPFYISSKEQSIGQLSLFDEDNYLILIVRVKTAGQALPDIFYLFFRNDKSNFGISHDSSPIDTSQKSIIGIMAANFARATYNNLYSNLKKTEDIKSQVTDLLEFHGDGRSRSENRELSEWKKSWVMDKIAEIGRRDDVNYVYHENTIKLLTENSYSYSVIKKAIEESAQLARLLSPLGSNGQISVESFHVKFTDVIQRNKEVESQSETETIITRMDRAYQLLDRLENAAQKLLKQNIQPSSERVGRAMDNPVTAPAIRDSLKKHQARVVQLLSRYPDRWLYIRSQFRPIKNLFPKDSQSNVKVG